MLSRLTDNSRAVIRRAFRRRPYASETDLILALSSATRPRGLAARVLSLAGVEADRFPPGEVAFDRPELVAQAVVEARRRGDNHVGTEHLLLCVARRRGSHLARLGLTAEKVEALLSDAVEEVRRARRPLAARLGDLALAAWDRLRRRSS